MICNYRWSRQPCLYLLTIRKISMEKIPKFTEAFANEEVREILKLHFKDPKTKIREDAARLVAEILHKLVTEAILRSKHNAWLDGESEIQLEHVENILPMLMLDFS